MSKIQINSKAILPALILIGVLWMSFMPDNSPAVMTGQLNDQPQYEILKAEASDYESQAQRLEEEAKLKAQKAEALKKLAETEEAITNLDVEQKAITAEQVTDNLVITPTIATKPDINSILNEHEVRIYHQCKALELTTEQTAFVLANTRHETGQYRFLKEIDGIGQARRLGYQGGENWYGRGYIQLTHLNNYKNWTKWTGKDLVANPDLLVTDLELSAFVACSGIKHGSFTAKGKVSDYINNSKKDYYNARSLVNGDKHKIGNKIVGYTHEYITKLNQI
jgi:predicted chitinase